MEPSATDTAHPVLERQSSRVGEGIGSRDRGGLGSFFSRHPKTKWTAIIVAALIATLVIVLSLFDWNAFRPTLAKMITAKTGRPASIDGDLKVHLWSWTPSAEINGLTLGNPDWAERTVMFGAKRITLSVSLPRLLRGQIVIPQIVLQSPQINLERDAKGRASWELGDAKGTPTNQTQEPAKLPTVRSLIIDDGSLHVVDKIRKLTFSGSLVAADKGGDQDTSAFKIRSTGSLNAKPFRLDADGGPLLDLTPDKPYHFSAHLAASDIKLDTDVSVLEPFDLGKLDVKFVVSGDDLADVFYLTGLALPNTPKYRLGATVHVSGNHYQIDDLKGSLGTSDIAGKVQVELVKPRPKFTATLSSNKLNFVDLAPTLGQPAPTANPRSLAAPPQSSTSSTSPPAPSADDRLLPDADLQVNRVRGMDADVTYKALSVLAPKLPMQSLNLHVVLDNGLLRIDPLSFVLDQGRFSGTVQIDARKDIPQSSIDMRIEDVNLGQFKSATMKEAPIDGSLAGRFQIHGEGSSIHKLAASSDGAISVVIPHGQINQAFAELTGINVLKGLGLLLKKDQTNAEIRCGIIDFKDQDGVLNTTTVFVDTSTVLITGRGKINLDSENVNLALQGDPKQITFLRLRSPITLGGTMDHPKVGIQAEKLAAQAGVAAALGTLLTPAAAALAFIDPGLAKNKDCSDVMALADAGVKN